MQGAVVDIAPVRRAHAVLIPDTAIGESGLAADRPVSFAEAHFVGERADAISLVKGERRITRRERGQRTSALKDHGSFLRDVPQRVGGSQRHWCWVSEICPDDTTCFGRADRGQAGLLC